MDKPNIKLMKQVFNHILANPEQWDQKLWHCDTSHCFAGWTVLLGDPQYVKELILPAGYDVTIESYPNDFINYRFNDIECALLSVTTEEKARELLGISPDMSKYLFDYYLSLREIQDTIITWDRLWNSPAPLQPFDIED